VESGTHLIESLPSNLLLLKAGIYYGEFLKQYNAETGKYLTLLSKNTEDQTFFYFFVSNYSSDPIVFPYSRRIDVFGSCVQDAQNIHSYMYTRTSIAAYTLEEIESGESVDIEIDQTYNPESENAQSGKAVAEALKPKEYELINTITVAPDTDGSLPSTVAFSADSEGNTFALDNFYIRMRAKTTEKTANVSVTYKNPYGNNAYIMHNTSIGITNTNFKRTTFRYFKLPNGYTSISIDTSIADTIPTYYSAQAGIARSAFLESNSTSEVATKKFDYIGVEVQGGEVWDEGSTFELWGVRE
jgi:hypothetical protein